MTKTNLRLAGLFAGVGGIELGFQKAGFEPIFANEIDLKASVTYRLNHSHELVTKDVNFLDSKELPKIEVLTGGFPCQAFSIAGHRGGFNDTRGTLFHDVARILKKKQPDAFLLENVKGLLSMQQGRVIRFAPLELPDSRILRLNRLYPGTQVRATVRSIQVPAPLTSLVNGQVLKNQELLNWITELFNQVFEDELKGTL